MPEKHSRPERKLPKKSKRPKRRYILFSLKKGSCTGKQAFDIVMKQFSLEDRKSLGIWFIGFDKGTGKGIVRCRLGCEKQVGKRIKGLPKDFEPKLEKTSGTLRKLREK